MQGWGGGEGLAAALCHTLTPSSSKGPVGKVHRFPFKGMGLPTACKGFPCNSPRWLQSLKGTGWKKDELPQHGLPWEGRCWGE